MKHWTNKEKLFLKEHYGKINANLIAKILNRSVHSVHGYGHKFGISANMNKIMQKYSVNNNYFKTPNINNCYWAGFIAADGCITKKHRLEINISIKDKCILEKFVENVGFTGPIKNNINTKVNNVRISISSPEWQQDLLNNWNITKQKTNTLQPPDLTKLEHKLAYIIGYIDGDGSIYRLSKTQFICLHICGGLDIVTWIQKTLSNIEDSKYGLTKVYSNKNKTCYSIRYVAKRARLVLSELNKIQTPYRLSRKWDQTKNLTLKDKRSN